MPGTSALVLLLAVLFAHPGEARGQAPGDGRDDTQPEGRVPEPDRTPDAPKRRLSEPFHTTGDDLRGVLSRDNGLWLGAGSALALLASTEDREASRRLAASATADRFFEAGEVLGGAWVQVGGAVATYAVGAAARRPALAHLGRDLVRAQALNGFATHALKLTLRRTRPDGGRYSLPSGHASGSFATAAVLGRHLGPKVGLPAFALATYVAVSRVQEQRHFPSDVILGAAIGIAAGRTVTAAHGRRSLTLEPIASPEGGVGLAVTIGWRAGRS